MTSVIASLFSHARPPLPTRASYLEHRMLPTATATRLRLHPAARLARSFRLARDLALEFRIDPVREVPARMLRVRCSPMAMAVSVPIAARVTIGNRPRRLDITIDGQVCL